MNDRYVIRLWSVHVCTSVTNAGTLHSDIGTSQDDASFVNVKTTVT